MVLSDKVVIVDYRTGNVNSVKRALGRIGADPIVSSSPDDIGSADKIIFPGVGHFGAAMGRLHDRGLIGALTHAVLVDKKPVLGICLGMELMALRSEEGSADGLGWIAAEAVRFRLSEHTQYKIPQMGWNQVSVKKESRLMDGIEEGSEFYFAHAYHLSLIDPAVVLSETEYETSFVSAIEKENIFGVQFHPEKSHDAGMRLLKNFVEM
jgi:glutamine amidotransferase